jgi:hypothetical protein
MNTFQDAKIQTLYNVLASITDVVRLLDVELMIVKYGFGNN